MCTTIGASGRDCVYYVTVTLSDLFQPNGWFYGLTSFQVIFLGGPMSPPLHQPSYWQKS